MNFNLEICQYTIYNKHQKYLYLKMIGFIYKIICTKNDMIYIGSTKNKLYKRFNGHKQQYKKWLNGEFNHEISIFKYFKEFGVENFKMIEIEQIEYKDKKELLIREQYYIDNHNCINKINAYIPDENKKDKRKEYYEKNREIIREKRKETYICECGDEITKSHKVRHEESKKHKDFLNGIVKVELTRQEYHKQWTENNKEHVLEYNSRKYTCECGVELTIRKKSRHIKTKYHLDHTKN